MPASETTPLLPEPSPSSPRAKHGRHGSWALPNLNTLPRRKADDGTGAVSTGPSNGHGHGNGHGRGDGEGNGKSKKRTYALYALLVLLGVGIGVGATVVLEHRPAAKPPMVPPIYKLPPPTGLPRNPAYLSGPGIGGVAAEDKTCSEMGVSILRDKNGTAVDAAITTTLCIGLLNGFSSGIGGGGFAIVSLPEGMAVPAVHDEWEVHPEFVSSDSASDDDEGTDDNETLANLAAGHDSSAQTTLASKGDKKQTARVLAIDFRETAPAAAHPHMYAKKGRQASQVGGLSVSVPGELRGLEAAYKMYGKVPWAELVEPVIKLARGWQVSRELARRIRLFGAFMLEDETWAEVYAPRGPLLVEGDWVARHKYADTLEIIAREGPSALYSGAIADDIVDTVKAHGGVLTHQDLADYRARVYPAVKGTFAGQTVYTADAPASGGVMLGMLHILDPLLDRKACWDEKNSHNLIEAMKFAFGARSEITDPKFAKNLTRLAEFRTKAWADAKRALITNVTHEPDYYGLDTEPIADSGTTHLSVVDQWGGAASVTSTVNLIWGSHLMTSKTGIILNDEQDDFAVPGQPDAFGLPPSPWNYPQPGKRPLSSTAPAVVHSKSGQVTGVFGGSGGSRIFPSVAQVLVNLACGDDLSAAIERPRLHDQILPAISTLEVGPDGVDTAWIKDLERRGHHIGQFDINVGSSEVQGVMVDKRGVWASSDSRKNGIADVY